MYKEKPLVRRHYLHLEGKLEVTVKAETKQAFLERIFFHLFFFCSGRTLFYYQAEFGQLRLRRWMFSFQKGI